MPFSVSQEVTDQSVMMTLSGEADASAGPAFMAELELALQDKPKQRVLFVSDVGYITATFTRALLFALQRNPGLDIYVIAPQEQPGQFLKNTGLINTSSSRTCISRRSEFA